MSGILCTSSHSTESSHINNAHTHTPCMPYTRTRWTPHCNKPAASFAPTPPVVLSCEPLLSPSPLAPPRPSGQASAGWQIHPVSSQLASACACTSFLLISMALGCSGTPGMFSCWALLYQLPHHYSGINSLLYPIWLAFLSQMLVYSI